MRVVKNVIAICTLLLLPTGAWAFLPFVTDDTVTQGTGKIQLQINGEYDYDRTIIEGVSIKERDFQGKAILSYGIAENADIILSSSYEWDTVTADGFTISSANGVSDTTLEAKWRFYKKDGLSVAIKPGVIIPTGNDEEGLGAGKVGYSAFFLATEEAGPWTFSFNLGYTRHENKVDERNDLWRVSLATTMAINENLKAVVDMGMESDTDKTSDTIPAFIVGGFIYSVTKNLDINFGVQGALNKADSGYSLLAGIAYRF